MSLRWELLAGYLLDALERLDREPARAERTGEFVRALDSAATKRSPSPGLGEDIRLRGDSAIGGGLELDGELLQLSAFASENGGGSALRIARPSLRRD